MFWDKKCCENDLIKIFITAAKAIAFSAVVSQEFLQ